MLVVCGIAFCFMLGCASRLPESGELHRWWSGLGPVIPHDGFPADCSLCHKGETWNELIENFSFDHARMTGTKLEGAHDRARCLRCHNDRGPVQVFAAQGCAGCHTDFHQGELGPDCKQCHVQETWRPVGQRERHARGRFPLTGAHAAVACHQCHPGAFAGRFFQTDSSCVTCHQQDLARALLPPHIALGFVDNCDRCHPTTSWNHAVFR